MINLKDKSISISIIGKILIAEVFNPKNHKQLLNSLNSYECNYLTFKTKNYLIEIECGDFYENQTLIKNCKAYEYLNKLIKDNFTYKGEEVLHLECEIYT